MPSSIQVSNSRRDFKSFVIKSLENSAYAGFAAFTFIGLALGYMAGAILGGFFIRIVAIGVGGFAGFTFASAIYGVLFILLDIRRALLVLEEQGIQDYQD